MKLPSIVKIAKQITAPDTVEKSRLIHGRSAGAQTYLYCFDDHGRSKYAGAGALASPALADGAAAMVKQAVSISVIKFLTVFDILPVPYQYFVEFNYNTEAQQFQRLYIIRRHVNEYIIVSDM